jgi:hypothetical protein
MKKPMQVVVAIVAVIAAALAAGWYLTGGLSATADDFFAAVQRRDLGAAHALLSEEFKLRTPQPALEQLLAREELLDFKDASWSKRRIKDGRGELHGEVLTSSGAVVALQMWFVKENDTWKINAIGKPTVEL